MNHIAQYRNGIHHQIHHNPCPPIHNFTARFPSPSLGPLPDNVMMPQIISDGTLHYHNAPLQSFISGADSRQQQNDNSDKVSSNHRKQTMIRNFQPSSSSIISSQTASCSTNQDPPSKGPDSNNCNDHNYKTAQSTSVENHQFIHCESFISGTDSRQQQQQNDNSDKVSTHRKQTMMGNFQPSTGHIISTQTPSCSTRQESPSKGPESNNCNDHNYKPSQNSSVENHQFIQHCDSFMAGADNRQQQSNDNTEKVSNHRKHAMIRNFHPVAAPILSSQAPSCLTRQEPSKVSDSNGNDQSYKSAQSSSVQTHQFIQHCDQGAKNCVQCYNLLKSETPGAIVKVMVDAATMTDQEELDQSTGSWSLVSNSLPPTNTKVTEYLSNLRQFLKVDNKPQERKRQRQGDVRIVTSPDGSRLYFCPECHAAYPDKNLLEPHLAAHKIERRFICNVCGAGLKRKEHLDRHQLSHSEERPYSCSVCSKTFKRNEHLSRHSIIHSGLKPQDRPWVCGVCGRGHARKEHLDRHQVSHSDVRPFSCHSCTKTFKRSEHLSRHLIIHSSQKTEHCRECGKTFYRKDHLRKHAESHYKKRNKQPLPNAIQLAPPIILSSAM